MKKTPQEKEMATIEAKSKKVHQNTLRETQKVEAQIGELKKRKPKSREEELKYTQEVGTKVNLIV